MPRHYESSAAVCPFYNGEESTLIFCDGFSQASTIRISFRDVKSAKRIKYKYCRADWQSCPLARALIGCHKG